MRTGAASRNWTRGFTEGHNKLAGRLLEQEQSLNRVRRVGVNNFKLICKVGVYTGVLPEGAVKESQNGFK